MQTVQYLASEAISPLSLDTERIGSRRFVSRLALHRIHIARAFQAYNHFELLNRLVKQASGRTGLIVAPQLPLLSEHADQPEAEIRPLYERVVATLAELANALVVPILVSAPHAVRTT